MDLYNIENNSAANLEHVIQMVKHFLPYAQKQLGFHKPVMISFQSDEENANKLLGKTGYYNPADFSIAIFVDGRHPKDVLRSLSHELVHHSQNCNGDFDSGENLGPGYAQENPAMRNAELDAYKRGNIIFRDFEDLIKKGKIKVNINFEETGEPKMSLKEWKNNELNMLLLKKWGLLKEGTSIPKAGRIDRTDIANKAPEGWIKESDAHDPEAELEEGTPAYRKDDDWGKSPAAFTGTEKEEEEASDDLKKGKGLQEDSEGEETYHYGEDEGEDEKELHDLERRHATRAHIDALKRDMSYDEEHERRREKGTRFREGVDSITLDEARDLARRIFEKLTKETK